jgi:hypothetical protein
MYITTLSATQTIQHRMVGCLLDAELENEFEETSRHVPGGGKIHLRLWPAVA